MLNLKSPHQQLLSSLQTSRQSSRETKLLISRGLISGMKTGYRKLKGRYKIQKETIQQVGRKCNKAMLEKAVRLRERDKSAER
jgi:hypothetical protein